MLSLAPNDQPCARVRKWEWFAGSVGVVSNVVKEMENVDSQAARVATEKLVGEVGWVVGAMYVL